MAPRAPLMSAAALALAACAAPPPAGPPDRLRDAPPPALVPTARFEAPLRRGADAGAALAAGAGTLAARAEALRARAEALEKGALDPETRARLRAAAPRGG